MRLGYDRIKHQGVQVEFPPDRSSWRRKAYGRNGVGRHGLLCFADQYLVETWREGKGAGFEIGTQSSETPFKIVKETSFLRHGSGSRLAGRRSLADQAQRIAFDHFPGIRRVIEKCAILSVEGCWLP